MIQPIIDVLTNWRNPQHRTLRDRIYKLGQTGPLTVAVITDSSVSVVYRSGTHYVTTTIAGAAPEISTASFGGVTVQRIVVPYDSITSYIAWKKDSETDWHIIRDNR